MDSLDQVVLGRDITAVQIPNGNSVALKKGSPVSVTQSLGGSYTIHVAELGGLYRVASQDADALGQQSSEKQDKCNAELPLTDRVWITLKTCYDPEIPVNIVDLGLVYSMELQDVSEGKKVEIKMTLTAPGCGMGPSIAADAKSKLVTLTEIKEANIEIVWEPQWNPSMITPDGKLKLGIS
ncbi:MAG: iron-sulfur cluster assembly protein [Blastochloris sp.]|jgi:probable FeS assembly SUF system protein SufT|nr:iron-sulfur cluster assembly protein [Blastochloris sp.]